MKSPEETKGTREYSRKVAISKGAKKFAVYCDEAFIGEWISQRQCSIDLGLNNPKLRLCLMGKRGSHHGYTFEYTQDQDLTCTRRGEWHFDADVKHRGGTVLFV